jgi:hypothetical protein
MGLRYGNLDDRTRRHMVAEFERDVAQGTLYYGKHLNDGGRAAWPTLLREAIESHDDEWLACRIRESGYLATQYARRTPSGGMTMAKVPVTAPDTLAQGEFNRFYVRGLCARAIQAGTSHVEACRGRESANPRAESEAMVGRMIPAADLLADLRTSPGVDTSLGLPPGPNSGITVASVFG